MTNRVYKKAYAVTDASQSLDMGSPPPTEIAYFKHRADAEKVQATIWPYFTGGVKEVYLSMPEVFDSVEEYEESEGKVDK